MLQNVLTFVYIHTTLDISHIVLEKPNYRHVKMTTQKFGQSYCEDEDYQVGGSYAFLYYYVYILFIYYDYCNVITMRLFHCSRLYYGIGGFWSGGRLARD